mgnify:FL=1
MKRKLRISNILCLSLSLLLLAAAFLVPSLFPPQWNVVEEKETEKHLSVPIGKVLSDNPFPIPDPGTEQYGSVDQKYLTEYYADVWCSVFGDENGEITFSENYSVFYTSENPDGSVTEIFGGIELEVEGDVRQLYTYFSRDATGVALVRTAAPNLSDAKVRSAVSDLCEEARVYAASPETVGEENTVCRILRRLNRTGVWWAEDGMEASLTRFGNDYYLTLSNRDQQIFQRDTYQQIFLRIAPSGNTFDGVLVQEAKTGAWEDTDSEQHVS